MQRAAELGAGRPRQHGQTYPRRALKRQPAPCDSDLGAVAAHPAANGAFSCLSSLAVCFRGAHLGVEVQQSGPPPDSAAPNSACDAASTYEFPLRAPACRVQQPRPHSTFGGSGRLTPEAAPWPCPSARGDDRQRGAVLVSATAQQQQQQQPAWAREAAPVPAAGCASCCSHLRRGRPACMGRHM